MKKFLTLLDKGSLYVMLIPAMIMVFIFAYIPMYGVIIAFQDYNPLNGFTGSPFVGTKWFEYMFTAPGFGEVLFNTLYIAVSKIVIGTICSLAFALFLNEVKNIYYKKVVQTITYVPFFLSWVILGNIFINLLSADGPINRVLDMMGMGSVPFLSSDAWFPWTIIITATWQSFGWNSILYMAAITGIDPGLYEYSHIEGAGKFKQMWYVTIPCIMPTIMLLALLSLSGILNAGFDQILVMYNPTVFKSGDVIDTFVYRAGLNGGQFSLATAVGLFKSVICCILILTSYRLADKVCGYRII